MNYVKEKLLHSLQSIKPELRKRILLILCASVVLTIVLMIHQMTSDQYRTEENQFMIRRSDKGKQAHTEKLLVDYGEGSKEIVITINNQAYTEEEFALLQEQSISLIEERMLSENTSFERVETDLELVRFIPETGVSVKWEHDNYQVMNVNGKLFPERIPEEGSVITLRARLSIDEWVEYHEFYVHVFRPVTEAEEGHFSIINELIQEAEELSRKEEWLVLPAEVEDQPLVWSRKQELTAFFIIPFGVFLVVLLLISEKNKAGEAEKDREKMLLIDYPSLIHKFTLYLSAGMPARVAWIQMGEEYLLVRDAKGHRSAYDEVLYTMYAIQSGKPESECYELFGKRCKVVHYRKFGLLLSQNLRKGTKGLVHILKQEAETAYIERKNIAKKLGEQAGTKLMLPMFINLGIVLLIIIVPAFLSMQM